ncbi:unnamed protein product [Rotaria sp. Silwood1]|nr:unnamed protein product [Rotaria sp. Silwood1]CAF4932890.1 unnamed protein product [Rotaria sp. Silwood1]
MIHKFLLFVLLLFSSPCFVFSLQCYISVIPFVLNYSVTADTLPSFDNCSLVDTSGECTFTIIWLRNPISSMIIFGYDSISNENISSSDSILASVQYQLEGDELNKRLSHDVQYICKSFDGCNNGINLKRILKSIHIEENFSGRFNFLIATNQSFNNQSINECYFNRSSNDCLPIDYSNCRRCQISMNFFYSSVNEICATCPRITPEFNSIKRNAIFIVNNRSQVVDRVQLSCQIGEHCNSIENVYQIRQASLIYFDFDRFSFY